MQKFTETFPKFARLKLEAKLQNDRVASQLSELFSKTWPYLTTESEKLSA